ncbi:MAG: hypothetical protein EB130_09465 [Actinobacteria bacterium]|nr:hypothetical protein [Actinomycetota bacterium]
MCSCLLAHNAANLSITVIDSCPIIALFIYQIVYIFIRKFIIIVLFILFLIHSSVYIFFLDNDVNGVLNIILYSYYIHIVSTCIIYMRKGFD